jgi:hypothetical protein
MFLALWEFEVKSGCADRFQSAYGPQGEWVRLFRTDPSFIESRLLQDPYTSNKFVTLDFWRTRAAYECFKELNHAAYLELDKSFEKLTVLENYIGMFDG